MKEDRKLKCGWLSPSGEFIECNPYDHIAVAEEVLGSSIPSADEQLLNSGWVKIYRESFCGHKWGVTWYKFLTDSQKSFLSPLFKDKTNDFLAYCKYEFEDELKGVLK